VPHYWKHVMWVWGHDDLGEFLAYPDGVNLDGVIEKISVPISITHGENDRQIPFELDLRRNGPKRTTLTGEQWCSCTSRKPLPGSGSDCLCHVRAAKEAAPRMGMHSGRRRWGEE